jgi:hypothetical protein
MLIARQGSVCYDLVQRGKGIGMIWDERVKASHNQEQLYDSHLLPIVFNSTIVCELDLLTSKTSKDPDLDATSSRVGPMMSAVVKIGAA